MIRNVFSFVVLFVNSLLWIQEWQWVVKFSTMRHEKTLWVSFVLFFVIVFAQFVLDIFFNRSVNDEEKDYKRIDAIMTLSASLLLALSILAALPMLRESSPIMQIRFHWGALLAFLWIVFGVFWTLWYDTDNNAHKNMLIFVSRSIKIAALSHSIAWAGTAAIMLVTSIGR